jgi:vaccinia related kinase
LRANIKPTKTGDENYYLVDYGLAERYRNPNGKHREEIADKKRANNGTVEYRSRDAHIGLISRRSDIECLAYNLIQWLYGALPWINSLNNAIKVQEMKEYFMDNIDEFLVKSFGKKSVPKGLKEFLVEINKAKFDSEPKYSVLKNILINKLAKNKRSVNDDEEEEEESDEEVIRYSPKRKKTNSKSNLNSDKNSINNKSPKKTLISTNSKSPKKTLISTNNKSPKRTSRKSSDVIVISDDDDNESDAEVLTRSPPKRAKNSLVRLRSTPLNSKSNLKPRFSTPLLFCTSSEDNNTSLTEEEEVLTGADIETPEMMAIRKLMEKKKKEMEDKKKKRNRK